MKKILVTTGGTGGHVIPAEVIIEHLKSDHEIFLTTDLRGLKYLKLNLNKIKIINTPKLTFNFYFLFNIIKLFYLTVYSIIYLKKEKIDKVISTGGYMSLPICVAAKLLKVKIYLLEPNLTIGRANKFFLNFSKKFFVTQIILKISQKNL